MKTLLDFEGWWVFLFFFSWLKKKERKKEIMKAKIACNADENRSKTFSEGK